MISFVHKGNFDKTEKFLKKSFGKDYRSVLERFGQRGVTALSAATPIESGQTANSWSYDIIQNDDTISIVWNNDHIVKGVNIAVILQYGHGTRNGGWVQGRDYINPALRLIFDELAEAAWREVTRI